MKDVLSQQVGALEPNSGLIHLTVLTPHLRQSSSAALLLIRWLLIPIHLRSCAMPPGRWVLVNLNNGLIHLWSVDDICERRAVDKPAHKYSGQVGATEVTCQ